MESCVTFPVRQTTDVIFYVTNVVLIPLLFGIGLMGSLLGLIVFNHRYIRRESAVYVYLSGLSAMDLFTMLAIVPSAIRNMEVLPPEMTYSRLMTQVNIFAEGFEGVFRHSATWLMTIAVVVRCAGVCETPGEDSRLSRISVSRVVAFLVFLFCALVNFPKFFESAVVEVTGHCFTGLSLWDRKATDFGRSEIATFILPWAECAASYALPILILTICIIVLCFLTGWRELCRRPLILRHAPNADDREWQLTVALLTTASLYTLLEIPNVVCHCLLGVYGQTIHDNDHFNSIFAVANCLSLVHVALNVIIFALNNADFRKALGRSCCCMCNTTDEYYEPYVCCSCCRSRTRNRYTVPKTKSKRRPSKSRSVRSSDKSSSKVSDDGSQTSFGLHSHQGLLKGGWI